ncbi:uncharacterized protein LY79DRAFT_538584 [Colletotrichum navitas]|uniref:Uncharacterized protein n=1 Tax=Colletotrichum navitas TaxID=681940 RepID=A0AAD8QBI3_9PEZI|nr:uncharacterized protein LY79DRAFT_538584 [Colletotrichum navitas]KAK1598243.1 hypothetical protein LY79DRAFT_538584 [Colletotrichum navitas]
MVLQKDLPLKDRVASSYLSAVLLGGRSVMPQLWAVFEPWHVSASALFSINLVSLCFSVGSLHVVFRVMLGQESERWPSTDFLPFLTRYCFVFTFVSAHTSN